MPENKNRYYLDNKHFLQIARSYFERKKNNPNEKIPEDIRPLYFINGRKNWNKI